MKRKNQILALGIAILGLLIANPMAEAGPPQDKGNNKGGKEKGKPQQTQGNAANETGPCNGCNDNLPLSICYSPSYKWEFPESFLRITLSNVPSGYDVSNNAYPGWCVEAFNFDLFPYVDHCDTTLRVTTESLPAHLQHLPWGIINYILNNKQGTARDVANVIWYYTDSYVPPLAEQTPEYFALRNDAAGKNSYVPGPNQTIAVVLDRGPNGTEQKLIIEVTCPPSNPGTGTIGYWKNHPDAWPVSTIQVGNVTYTKQQAIDIMKTPTKGDKTFNLAEQLIAAKLNVLIGNDSSCIADSIANADDFLAAFPIGSDVKASSVAWKSLGGELQNTLDNYNNGLLCAPSRD